MKKTVLYATIFLLIASTFLVTATARPLKEPTDPIYIVTFTGSDPDSYIVGTVELFCRDRGKKWDLYGYVDVGDLTFVGSAWQFNNEFNEFDWGGSYFGGMRIFISKETGEVMDMFFGFDTQPVLDTEYNYFLYSLRGPTSDGTYDISQTFIERSGKGKKGSLSMYDEYITSLPLEFTVTVEAKP
jgi:hypothetical protein